MKRYRITDLAAWDDMVSACAGATWFHRAPWLGAVAEAVGGRFEGALFERADGTIGLVPIVRRPAARGWWTTGVCGTPGGFGGYGGLVASTAWAQADVDAAFCLLERDRGDWHIAGNPHAPGAHLPTLAATSATETAWVLSLAPTRQVPADPDLFWVAGPREFHVERLGSLEPDGAGRSRALYYHLFRRSDADNLALAVRLEAAQPVAGALVGLDGPHAYVVALAGAPHQRLALLGQIADRLRPGVRRLDVGVASAGPAGAIAHPVATWRRLGAPTRLFSRLRREPRRAS